MNTLIFGGNGFIGSHLVDKLLAEGHTVGIFDKYKEYFREPIQEGDYCFGDFRNRGLVSDALADKVLSIISWKPEDNLQEMALNISILRIQP